MFSSRAQGTIEYLIMIAIIVVIGLLVTGLMATSFSQTGQINQKTGNLPSITSPISILDSAVDGDGNGLFVLQNNEGQNLTITKITLNGEDNNYNTAFAQGNKIPFLLNDLTQCQCSTGDTVKTCTIIIYYTTNYGITKSYTHTITTDCVSQITPPPTVERPADVITPTVFLLSPANNDINQNTSIRFDFNATDDKTIASCSLSFDGTDINSNATLNGSDGYFIQSLSSYSDQIYSWNVSCTDGTNSGNGTDRNINLDLNSSEITYCAEFSTSITGDCDGGYKLTEDINCYTDTQTASGAYWNDGNGFEPLCSTNGLQGTFDGDGHIIYNLYINRPNLEPIGFFKDLNHTAVVMDLGFEDANITGGCRTGGIAGITHIDSAINSVFFKGDINGSWDSCPTIFSYSGVGGLVGKHGGVINNSYSTGTINVGSTHSDDGAGGLVGHAAGGVVDPTSSSINNAYSTMNIVSTTPSGGIMGFCGSGSSTGYINYTFAVGDINGPTEEESGVINGGLSGACYITDSYWYNSPNDLAVSCWSGDPTDDCQDNNKAIDYFKGTGITSSEPFSTNWNFTTTWKTVENDYPKLIWED